jgi:hypothetical protein
MGRCLLAAGAGSRGHELVHRAHSLFGVICPVLRTEHSMPKNAVYLNPTKLIVHPACRDGSHLVQDLPVLSLDFAQHLSGSGRGTSAFVRWGASHGELHNRGGGHDVSKHAGPRPHSSGAWLAENGRRLFQIHRHHGGRVSRAFCPQTAL